LFLIQIIILNLVKYNQGNLFIRQFLMEYFSIHFISFLYHISFYDIITYLIDNDLLIYQWFIDNFKIISFFSLFNLQLYQ
jgi:hypothetical protein